MKTAWQTHEKVGGIGISRWINWMDDKDPLAEGIRQKWEETGSNKSELSDRGSTDPTTIGWKSSTGDNEQGWENGW